MVRYKLTPMFMSKSTRLVSLFIVFFLLSSFSTPIYAADGTTQPTVTSMTGPTSGVVGTAYSFTTNAVSDTGHEITTLFLRRTTDVSTTAGNTGISNVNSGGFNCTAYSCGLTSTFTPTVAGTYYIYTTVNFAGTSCNTHPSLAESNCFESRGHYITFVVTDGTTTDDSLPSTGLLSNQTKNIYIGLGFIFLGILSTQVFRITDIVHTLHERNTSKKSEKRKSKFEQKF